MEHSSNQLLVKYPMNKGSLVASIILAVLILIAIIITPSNNPTILSLQLFCIVMCCLNAGLTMWWGSKKPHLIVLNTEQIIAKGTPFKVDSIQKIVIKGSSIGIKLKQKRVVPPELCITLMNETEGLQILKKWAERQHIKIVYGSFLRWY